MKHSSYEESKLIILTLIQSNIIILRTRKNYEVFLLRKVLAGYTNS